MNNSPQPDVEDLIPYHLLSVMWHVQMTYPASPHFLVSKVQTVRVSLYDFVEG